MIVLILGRIGRNIFVLLKQNFYINPRLRAVNDFFFFKYQILFCHVHEQLLVIT